MAYLNVKVNIDETGIENLLNNLIHDDATMLEVHSLFRKMCDPYVPFLEGPLSQTVEVEPNLIRYIQPYARYQYYGVNFNHTLDYHPQATALWDKAMLAEKGDVFKAEIKRILVRRAKELYG